MTSEKKISATAAETSPMPLSLIQQLTQDDLPLRSATLYQLFKRDWSGEEKALLVTALLELLPQPALPDRAALVLFLAKLARDRCRDWSALSGAVAPSGSQRPLSLRSALLRGLPLYLKLIEASEPQLRLSSLYLSAWLPEGRAHLLPVLLRRLEEEEEALLRAALVLALGQLAGDQQQVRAHLMIRLQAPEAPIVRLGAAIALVRLLRTKTPMRAVRLLVRAIAHPQAVAYEYDTLPWARHSVVADSSELLRLLPRQRLQFALPVLLEALASANCYEALSLARTLLYLGFASQRPGVSCQAITPTQQAILAALRTSLSAWQAGELLKAVETQSQLSAG
ncbi:hypothetical protein [Thermogemmatispora sp.]|uniref:hypothetical protein n=1 Tax=Thermogemmatispora sp. TaxID=1968838 RepID=UPI001DB4B7A6|nr:hypothetical protein [Thermogemmatispora sp.]MBX5450066.1 hypothetical protein [Thermogemmatispora sp.]